MSIQKAKSSETVTSYVERKTGFIEGMSAGGVFTVTCLDKDGNEKWVDIAPNLVVNTGLQMMNTQFFTGATYTAAWYIGLVNGTSATTTFSGGDTLATHAGWDENSSYAGTRPAATFGAATLNDPSNINNASTTASFTFTANATIAGAFLTNVASGTSPGLLFSAADFQSPGDRTVVTGDVLNVTYSFNLDAQ
jgi:hypothetical protein